METESWFKRIFSSSPPQCKQDFYNDGLGELAFGVMLILLSVAVWWDWVYMEETSDLFFFISIMVILILAIVAVAFLVRTTRDDFWKNSDAVKKYYKSIQMRKFDFVGFLWMAGVPFIIMVLLMAVSIMVDGVRYYGGITQFGALLSIWGIRFGYTTRKWRYIIAGVLAQLASLPINIFFTDHALQQLAALWFFTGIGLLFMGLFQFIRFVKQTGLAEG
jgi:hypothetical protein